MRSSGKFGDFRPAAWVVGDASAAVPAAEASGFRVSARMSAEEAVARLSARESGMLLLIDIGTQLSLATADLLDCGNDLASDGLNAMIVTCASPVLDEVAARISAPFATILCEPTLADRVLAMTTAMPRISGVAEIDRTAGALRILHLTDEVARIARALADLPDDSGGAPRAFSDGLTGYRGPPAPSAPSASAGDIRTLIRWRRRRDALVSNGLFSDPVWDMMLDLAAARIEGEEVSVSSLCIAAAVPATTALRWIKALTEAGLFVRVPDPQDRRRVYIRLADAVATAVLDYLGAARAAGAGLI